MFRRRWCFWHLFHNGDQQKHSMTTILIAYVTKSTVHKYVVEFIKFKYSGGTDFELKSLMSFSLYMELCTWLQSVSYYQIFGYLIFLCWDIQCFQAIFVCIFQNLIVMFIWNFFCWQSHTSEWPTKSWPMAIPYTKMSTSFQHLEIIRKP